MFSLSLVVLHLHHTHRRPHTSGQIIWNPPILLTATYCGGLFLEVTQAKNFSVWSLVSTNSGQTHFSLPHKCFWTDCWATLSWSFWQSLGAPKPINYGFKNTAFGTLSTTNYAQSLVLILLCIVISSLCPNCLSKHLIYQYLHLSNRCSL